MGKAATMSTVESKISPQVNLKCTGRIAIMGYGGSRALSEHGSNVLSRCDSGNNCLRFLEGMRLGYDQDLAEGKCSIFVHS